MKSNITKMQGQQHIKKQVGFIYKIIHVSVYDTQNMFLFLKEHAQEA